MLVSYSSIKEGVNTLQSSPIPHVVCATSSNVLFRTLLSSSHLSSYVSTPFVKVNTHISKLIDHNANITGS